MMALEECNSTGIPFDSTGIPFDSTGIPFSQDPYDVIEEVKISSKDLSL